MELELRVVSDRGVILGCVWFVAVITEADLVPVVLWPDFTRYTATRPFCVLWPTLPINIPESSSSRNIMDCSTNAVLCISIPAARPLKVYMKRNFLLAYTKELSK